MDKLLIEVAKFGYDKLSIEDKYRIALMALSNIEHRLIDIEDSLGSVDYKKEIDNMYRTIHAGRLPSCTSSHVNWLKEIIKEYELNHKDSSSPKDLLERQLWKPNISNY